MSICYKIGVDVGGTNTDAALLRISSTDAPSVVATYKSPTTKSVTDGITAAISTLLEDTALDRSLLQSVTIGTTTFVNALVERDAGALERVAVLRLCGPYAREVEPCMMWPGALRRVVDGGWCALAGGLEIDGQEIAPVNEEEIAQEAVACRSRGIRLVAVVGIFSPLDNDGRQEYRVKQIFHQTAPEIAVICSRDVGHVGFIERENSTILNCALHSLAQRVITEFKASLSALDLPHCRLFLTQNDGTLTTAEAAMSLPIKTFTCGPTNSMAGAAFLSDISPGQEYSSPAHARQVIVVDIGGTTTDVGFLQANGFPRQASAFVDIAGVRTAFAMPDVISAGLGGGSIIIIDEASGTITVGPESVGYRINTESLLAGGATLTATDVMVASGGGVPVPEFGNVKYLEAATIPEWVISAVRQHIKHTLEGVIDKMKTSKEPCTVLLVGGGALIVDDDTRENLEGVHQVVSVPHSGAANAVGAAMAMVSGEVDTVVILQGRDELEVEADLKQQAIAVAISNGAGPESTHVVSLDKTPLQYVHNGATRFVVKAVGKVAISTSCQILPTVDHQPQFRPSLPGGGSDRCKPQQGSSLEKHFKEFPTPSDTINVSDYRPHVERNVWYPSPLDLELLALGCGILGTGGGGSPYPTFLRALSAFYSAPPGTMRIIPAATLSDAGYCSFGAGYGAPSVSAERISSASELTDARNALLDYLKIPKDQVQAFITDEIGGGNGLVSLLGCCAEGWPVVDCDAMGRAFPTIEQGTPYFYGCKLEPVAVSDSYGSRIIVDNINNGGKLERILRSTAINLGLSATCCPYPLTGEEVKKYMVQNTLSQSWYLGRAIVDARQTGADFLRAIFDVTPGEVLFTGKVSSVITDTVSGYTKGRLTLSPLSTTLSASTETRIMTIPFQNEYLYAAFVDQRDPSGAEDIVCAVPDLISLLDVANGTAISSSELKYGLRVHVIALAADRHWKTAEGYKRGGLGYFGFAGKEPGPNAVRWKEVATVSRSVFEEFGEDVVST